MDVNGDWKIVNCFNNVFKYVCEKGMGSDCFIFLEKLVFLIFSCFECVFNIFFLMNGLLVYVVCL